MGVFNYFRISALINGVLGRAKYENPRIIIYTACLLVCSCSHTVTKPIGDFQIKNNSWYSYNKDSDTVIVFVHGILGDSHDTWLFKDEKKHIYWPELIKEDLRFNGASIYMGGYFTSVDSKNYGPSSATKELWNAISTNNYFDENNETKKSDGSKTKKVSALDKNNIIFVAHSTGGIVVRNMLIHHREAFKDKVVGLLLIASPSYGSQWANVLTPVTHYFENDLAKKLEYGSDFLEQLDDDFKSMREDDSIPYLIGTEAIENHFITHSELSPFNNLIVTKESGNRYFDAEILANTDHFSSVKPNNRDHPSYKLLLNFYLGKFEKKIKEKWYKHIYSKLAHEFFLVNIDFEKHELERYKIKDMQKKTLTLIDKYEEVPDANISYNLKIKKYEVLTNLYLISAILGNKQEKEYYFKRTIYNCELIEKWINDETNEWLKENSFKDVVLRNKALAVAIKNDHNKGSPNVKNILNQIGSHFWSEHKQDFDRDLNYSKHIYSAY